MNKRKAIQLLFSIMIVVACCLGGSCKNSSADSETDSTRRGEPQLSADRPEYDKDSKTFSLTLHTDSIADADVTYYLLDGDSILMKTDDGCFKGIIPLEEGYNVKAKVEWNDTTIMTAVTHVTGFVIPREFVDKLSKEDLKRLFDAKDKTSIETYLSQGIKLIVKDSKMKPTLINEVLLYLDNRVWKSVEVIAIEYDEYNYITSLTLKPVGEKVESVTDDKDEKNEFFDEY
jgi:hypothetical protein